MATTVSSSFNYVFLSDWVNDNHTSYQAPKPRKVIELNPAAKTAHDSMKVREAQYAKEFDDWYASLKNTPA